jgi:2-polyprenyl-6-methoxyphenol hydroxylase-like FAD-dependent oxidoreductase
MKLPASIVIVGAGPAGAMLALLLARRGIDVTLIERQRDFEREFRGEVLMPSGIEVFRQAGLADQFAKLPTNGLHRVRLFNRRQQILHVDLSQVLGRGNAFTAVSQPAMLEMVCTESSRHSSFQLERGTTMRELIVENERVVGVEIASGGTSRQIRADLVIGADGRASTVRRRSGLETFRRPQAFDIVWCKVPAPNHDSPSAFDGASVFLGNNHFSLAFPTFGDQLQIAWVIRKGAIGELRSRGIEQWIEEMANHVTADFGEHLRANIRRITQPFLLDVICDLMPVWTKPGLLLIGDAAHPMSPVGAQGINIALRDAVVAANHLVKAASESTSDQLCDGLDAAATAIQAERMPEVRTIQRMQQFPPRLLFANRVISSSFIAMIPLLATSGLVNATARRFVQRLAFGVSDVQLNV